MRSKIIASPALPKAGKKGLWITRPAHLSCRLVVAESAIDALSYATIYPDIYAIYVSTGGKMNSRQSELIRAVIFHLSGDLATMSHEEEICSTSLHDTGEYSVPSHVPEVIAAIGTNKAGGNWQQEYRP